MFADAFVLAADTARLSFNAKLLLFIHDLPIQRVMLFVLALKSTVS